MRALVTGAAGFVGSTLVDALLAGKHEVVGIDCFIDYYPRTLKESNLSAACKHPRFRFVEASIVDAPLEPLLDGIDVIFHQAAQAGVRTSWGDDFRIYSDNNVFGTQRLLEAARAAGVKRVVYASSSSIYGDTDDLPMREASRPQPVSPYGVTKLAAEHLAWLYWQSFQLPTVSLRYFTVYGPRQRPDMAFHRFIKAVLKDEPIHLYGDGDQTRDFTYVDDIVAVNIAAATADVAGKVFNVGGGSRTSVNEVIATIGAIVGREPRIQHHAPQKGDVRHTAADTSLARSLLGYTPRVSLREGLEREVAWVREAFGL